MCVGKLTINGSDNSLSPGRRQAIIQTNAGILLIGPLGTNFSEILSEIHIFSFKKIHLKLSSAKLRPFGFGLNVLTHRNLVAQLCIHRSSTVQIMPCRLCEPCHYLNQCWNIVPLGTNVRGIWIKTQFSFKTKTKQKMKMPVAAICLGLDILRKFLLH